MFLRRLIRNVLLVALLLCLGDWALSNFYATNVRAGNAPVFTAISTDGVLHLAWSDFWVGMNSPFAGIYFVPVSQYQPNELLDGRWGKSYYIDGVTIRVLDVPLWTLSTILAVTLAFAWWMSRGKAKPIAWNKKWLIRGAALAVVCLSAAAWTSSYYNNVEIKSGLGCHKLNSCQDAGAIYFEWQHNSDVTSSVRPYAMLDFSDTEAPHIDMFSFAETNFTFAGISYTADSHFTDLRIRTLGLPFWSLTLLLGLVAILAWRKTAHRPPSHAFPVEPAK